MKRNPSSETEIAGTPGFRKNWRICRNIFAGLILAATSASATVAPPLVFNVHSAVNGVENPPINNIATTLLNTGIAVNAGDVVTLTAASNDTWSINGFPVNASGFPYAFSGSHNIYDSPTYGGPNFDFGALVYTINGTTFGQVGDGINVGNTSTTFVATASGILRFGCWDSVSGDNNANAQTDAVIAVSVSVVPGTPPVTTVIDDKFDDGNIGTNTLGIGNGFVNGSQKPVSESGGFANFNAGGVSTEVIASNSANASNPFLASAAELTYTFGSIVAPSPSQRTRLWFGYRRTGPVGFVFYPGAIGTSFGSGRQGLYVSVFSQNVGEDGYTNQGNLVATDDSGVRTTLASWNWSNPADLSGLVVKLTTTATHYQLEFSGAPGGVPNFVFGAASGLISGMGTVSPSTAFDIGAMNQYFGGTGGQARLDSVLWRSGVPFTPPPTNAAPTDIALSSMTIDENNAPGATIGTLSATDADAGQTHTFSLVSGAGSTDNSAFTITGNSLTINAPADFETKNSYSIRIRATDSGAGNLTFEKQFTVNITDVAFPQVITFGPLGGKTFGDSDFAVSATGGASGQPVTFSIVSGPATISGGMVTITGAGDVTVRASQAGSGEYTAAADVDQTFTVAKAPQTLTFTARAKAATTATLPLSATGGASSQPVTYFVVSGPGLLTGNSLSFTGEGDVVVRASRAGDGNYLDAADVLVTITARVNTAPTAVDDAIAITSGDATIYALANDSDADGDEVSYFGVSEPSVTINGRVLIVPPAYSGSFTYTVTDGFSESTATVSVTAEAQLVSTRWQGLLYDNAGGIGGWMQATKTTTGQIIASLKVGSAIGTAKFRIPTGGSTTAPTQVGTLTASEAADGRLSVEIAGLAGNLRTGRGSATAAQLNVAIASINSAIPGGASARVLVRGGGDVVIFGKLPDGRGFSAKSRIADNGTFVAYSAIAKTLPKGIVAGEFTLANLAATDVTGELGWVLPTQASGLHKTGVSTILTANGCIYAPGVPLPSGAGTLSVEGGNLATDTSEANAISAGKPAATTLVPAWIVNSAKGTFTVSVKDPARLKRVAGTGVYLPKTNSAWGFFPGTTVGGRVKISVP